MTKSQTKRLIQAAGGDAAFAKLLGIEQQEGVAQRVNNWKRRGMPSAVELEHYEKIQELKGQISRRAASPSPIDTATA
jgi:DNA-binding transcriptional regulator YdaS (Cro superfamily)